MCWICPICSTANEVSTRICFVCGHERKRKRVPIEEIESSYEQGCAYYRNESYESAFELLNFAFIIRKDPGTIMRNMWFQSFLLMLFSEIRRTPSILNFVSEASAVYRWSQGVFY